MNNPVQIDIFQTQVIVPILSSIRRAPETNAFCINGEFYTYKQFGEYISQVRVALQALPDEELNIGLAAHDDLCTYSSIIALWLEGKAYIPLHPNQPLDRMDEIIGQMGITTILDSAETSRYTRYFVINANYVSSTGLQIENRVQSEEMLAYVLFTSGSTGVPKGVMITRSNVGAFMDSFWASGIKLGQEDRCLQCFDLTFDVSVQCYLAPLIQGACVYTVPHDQIKYGYVFGLFEDHELTFAAVAPSMLRFLRPYFNEIELPALKNCILTGEASPGDLALEWKACLPNASVYNFYGPTETTIYCTYYKISDAATLKTLNGMLSIGQPMKNVQAIIVDEALNKLPEGDKGELCIAGGHVSPGYWNNPEKNSEVFFTTDVGGKPIRYYHTGDLCFSENGNLMLFGRLDSQAKIQGYRVELGEIDHCARGFLKGNNAVTVTFTNAIGNTDLAIFLEGNNIDTSAVIAYMRTKLPHYMVPSTVLVETEFPLNSNGKVDKKALKESLAIKIK